MIMVLEIYRNNIYVGTYTKKIFFCEYIFNYHRLIHIFSVKNYLISIG